MSRIIKVKKFLSPILDIDENKLNDKTNMDNTSEWDSIAYIKIILALEKKFNIKLDNRKNAKITTFSSVLKIFKENEKK